MIIKAKTSLNCRSGTLALTLALLPWLPATAEPQEREEPPRRPREERERDRDRREPPRRPGSEREHRPEVEHEMEHMERIARMREEVEVLQVELQSKRLAAKLAAQEVRVMESIVARDAEILQKTPGGVSIPEREINQAKAEVAKIRVESSRLAIAETEIRLKYAQQRLAAVERSRGEKDDRRPDHVSDLERRQKAMMAKTAEVADRVHQLREQLEKARTPEEREKLRKLLERATEEALEVRLAWNILKGHEPKSSWRDQAPGELEQKMAAILREVEGLKKRQQRMEDLEKKVDAILRELEGLKKR